MKQLKHSLIYAGLAPLAGVFMVFMTVTTCQRFEPAGFLYITTDTVRYLSYGNYEISGTVVDIADADVTYHGFCWSETKSPTINGPSTQLGPKKSKGSFKDTISDLSPNTTYYIRAYVISSFGTEYGAEKSFKSVRSVTDNDGNIYRTVTIGDQTWMAENLKSTHYSDGTAIPLVTDGNSWDALTFSERAYCWYENNPVNGNLYGAQYVWAGATNNKSSGANPSSVQGACPSGWHLPSDAEWKQMEMHLGMSEEDADGVDWRGTDEGGKLKEAGDTHWENPNLLATNETGFTAFPGGYRLQGEEFYGMGGITYFYTATENDESSAWYRGLANNQSGIYRHNNARTDGFSIRCVEGEGSSSLPAVTTTAVSGITETSAQTGGEVVDDGREVVTVRGVCWNTSPGPTISDSKTIDGGGTGNFSSALTGLNKGTTYYVRAYATNSEGTGYGNEQSFKTWSGSVTDIDGNVYQTVVIGLRTWMAANLNVTHYADGRAIPLIENTLTWEALGNQEAAFCWYDNNASNGETYGALYSWTAAMDSSASSDLIPSGVQGVCPADWHLPSDEEWKELEISLGMSQEDADSEDFRGTDEGGKLKEVGSIYWATPNIGATNSSGFTSRPGGMRTNSVGFIDLWTRAIYWTATESGSSAAWERLLYFQSSDIARSRYVKNQGLSVRCLRDP